MSRIRRAVLRSAGISMVAGLSAALVVGPTAGSAAAAGAPGSRDFGIRVLAEAAKHNGKQYVYGGNGPSSFDCSGFTRYVYQRAVGKALPRTSAQQYAAVTKIRRPLTRPGDLIFFRTASGRVYHVAIYAGGGRIWHASNPRTDVTLGRIWTNNLVVGRVR